MISPHPPHVAGTDDQELGQALRRSAWLVESAAPLAMGLEELGTIDFPPSLGSTLDQAQLRAIASLYLASELESAGVVAAVEALAGLGHSGALGFDLGAAAPLVAHYWKTRNERATAEERAACFTRVFGVSIGFDEAMLELCEALFKLDEGSTNAVYGGIAQQMRVRAAARQLVERVIAASGGITVFIAQEILHGLHECLAILGHPGLRGTFGARDLWAVLATIDRLARTRHGDGQLYLRRGKAGMIVLAWLADAAVNLEDSGTPLVGLDHPVISAAVEWMQASLVIGEAGASTPGAAPAPAPAAAPSTAQPVSPWAAIAA